MPPLSVEKSDNVTILVVDDESSIALMISRALERCGYRCLLANNGQGALVLLDRHPVDVVITDIEMPGMNGVDLLKIIKQEYDADVMVMTGFSEEYDYEFIINAGANDFVQKPVGIRELLIRLERILHLKSLVLERAQINTTLKQNVDQLVKYSGQLENAHRELRYAYLDTINRLVAITEYKDEDTGDHIMRISHYSSLIAERLGVNAGMVELIQYASPMHDIGKIGIPDQILLKPGRLSKEEFEVVKNHTTIGANILENAKAEVLKLSYEIALTHHERFNGQGYPRGLSGKEIPLSGRIVALADTFDALTSNRPYKKPYPFEVAVDIIKSEKGRHFDPDITDTFIENIEEIRRIKEEVSRIESQSPIEMIWSNRDIREGLDKKIDYKGNSNRCLSD